MNTRSISKIGIVGTISLLYSLPLFSDAPYEKYHVAYKDISKDVLKNTIGILTINAGVKKGTELKTYLRNGKRFAYNKTLKVKKETFPVSNYGYHPPIDESGISNYRYPIVAKSNQYLCIVYNPIKNLKTWVNIKEIQQNFFPCIMMLDSIKTPGPFVDIFYFTKSGRRKLYKEPKKDANFVMISEDEPKYSKHVLLKIIEQKNGFTKIGILHIDYNTYETSVEPIGWTRIENDESMLTIWIKAVHLD